MRREDEVDILLLADDVAGDCDELDFSFATRCAVTGSIAEICMGGKLTGDLGFRVSVEDSVLPLFLPMRTEMRLSLRSLSSFFDFSLSDFAFSFSLSRAASLAFCSLEPSFESPCKLRLEVDLSNDGRPKLRTDDFR